MSYLRPTLLSTVVLLAACGGGGDDGGGGGGPPPPGSFALSLTGTATYVTTEAAQRAHIETLKQEVAEQKDGKLRCYCQRKRERGEKLGPKCRERLDAEPAAVGRAGEVASLSLLLELPARLE